MEDKHDNKSLSRRDFMKAAGATAASVVAGSLIPGKLLAAGENATGAPAPGSVLGANSRLNYAVIGIGGMGGGHLHMLKNMEENQNIRVAAVCDVFDKRRAAAQKTAGCPDHMVFGDYRKLLENKAIDVVVIATPDHWHAPIAIAALEAGKHVYVEKPMTRYLDEAFKLRDAVHRTGKLLQVGSQGCSDAKWHKAGELVRSGKIGPIIWAQGSYCRNNPNGEWNYHIDPDGNEKSIDWRMWLGSAPKRGWSPDRFFRWRKYWDYGTGIIGDLWPHRLHPLMIAMQIEDFPKHVTCVGANICNTDKGYGETRDVADATMLNVIFPNGAMIFLAGSTVNERGLEDMIRGQKANMFFGGGKIQIQPERPFADEIDQSDVAVVGPGESQDEHHKNLQKCIREGGKPNCDIELGTRVMAMVAMAEKSYRENKMCTFDPKSMKVRT